jgi:hypothetical protein
VEKREAERENLLRGYIIIDVDCASIKDGQLSRRPRCPDTVPINMFQLMFIVRNIWKCSFKE